MTANEYRNPASVSIIPEIGLTEIEGEPRARDIEIAERLGYARPRAIRDLIKNNLAEIEAFGTAPRRTAPFASGNGAVKETEEFWLNEEQALLLAALSKTENAAAVRAMLIRCFVAWRRGHLVPAVPAHSVADFEAEARKVIGGIVKSVVHAQVAPIVETVNALVAIVQPSVPGVVIRHGKTAGAILKANGFTGCPQALASWFGNRLAAAGCRVEGRIDTGTSRSRLFDPDKAEAWLANGGRASVEMKLAERRGQGALSFHGGKAISINLNIVKDGKHLGYLFSDACKVVNDMVKRGELGEAGSPEHEYCLRQAFVSVVAASGIRFPRPDGGAGAFSLPLLGAPA